MADKVSEAFKVIKQAMIDDNPSEHGSYAHGWHCNISMMCFDAIMADREPGREWASKVSNDAASRFMKLCFDVDTKA